MQNNHAVAIWQVRGVRNCKIDGQKEDVKLSGIFPIKIEEKVYLARNL